MGSCLDILEEELESQEQIESGNKAQNNMETERMSQHENQEEVGAEEAEQAEINSKMQTSRLRPLVRSNGLQRDNSTKEADPSGRIFR